jgi:glycosyltransferase involved in cell wall biosynthesis
MNNQKTSPDISLVIPCKDEAESLQELYARIKEVIEGMGRTFEIIFVDDGSVDNSLQVMRNLRDRDPRIKVISLQRNFGKSAALSAGFIKLSGKLVFTIDADLQDDPEEIPRFIQEIEKGHDLTSGWKKDRQDPFLKIILSRIFNTVTAWLSGVKIHDFNCGFKCYRREVLETVKIYGELHRFIPALAGARGFRVSEIVVKHHPRIHGKSKYGLERVPRGFFDLLTVLFISEYARRPLHLFGGLGALSFLMGFSALAYLTVLWFLDKGPIGTRPLFLGGIMLLLLGAQIMSLGLLAELILHLSARPEDQYIIKEILE